jgi:predicted O-linked N-acetylglucosamine transferase (SPINDLY family)
VNLATDRPRLAQLRERLHAVRGHASLFDTPRFARHLEAAYARMHERALAGLPPGHIDIEPARSMASTA